jgi:plastocyanin
MELRQHAPARQSEGRKTMIRRGLVAIALLAATLVFSSGANAGGWASVRLVDDQAQPVAGQPWSAELIVKQHDTHEVNVDELSVQFTHQESGTSLSAIGETTGQIGHYQIDVVFAKPGLWDWTATPAPFGPMSLASLQVLETTAAMDLGAPSATIVQGTCAAPGQQLGSIDLTDSDSLEDNGLATGVAADFGDIIAKSRTDAIAVIIQDATSAKARIACGELSASDLTTPEVVVLQPDENSQAIATISLVPGAGGVTATVTVMSQLAGQGVVIRITDLGDGSFAPGSITVPVGTTVTWQNDSSISHTVTGKQAGFLNSGMLDHGDSFSQTFNEAGTYSYACDPHAWMTGVINVVE